MANYSQIIRRARRAGMAINDYAYYTLISDPISGESIGISRRKSRCPQSDRRAMNMVRKNEIRMAL